MPSTSTASTTSSSTSLDTARLTELAISFDKGDARRIQHFLKVHSFARLIGMGEGFRERELAILEAAAILHDIGIHACEEKYGSTAGHYQEIEGPASARMLMEEHGGLDGEFMERVALLISKHHTYSDILGPDHRVLLEADFLVNAYEDSLNAHQISTFREKVFRTRTGLRLLDLLFPEK